VRIKEQTEPVSRLSTETGWHGAGGDGRRAWSLLLGQFSLGLGRGGQSRVGKVR
jgi:hypothetical protein